MGGGWHGTRVEISGLLHLEASRARVSQFCLKTDGGAMAGGACGINVEVAWK
jgi:hypothetical protein